MKPRNYRAEYVKYQSSTEAKRDRASRNKVRRAATRAGTVRKGRPWRPVSPSALDSAL